MTDTSRDDLKRFINTCEHQITINFPTIAAECDISYSVIQRQLAKKSWFYDSMNQMLQRLKFNLLEAQFQSGYQGKTYSSGDTTAAKFIIQMIDNGSLLKAEVPIEDDDTEEDVSDALEKLQKRNKKSKEPEDERRNDLVVDADMD